MAVVLGRLRDGLADERVGRHVDDRLGLLLAEGSAQDVCVEEVGADEARLGVDGRAVALREVVVDRDLVAVFDQLFGDDAADVAGAARDDYTHLLIPFRRRGARRSYKFPDRQAGQF